MTFFTSDEFSSKYPTQNKNNADYVSAIFTFFSVPVYPITSAYVPSSDVAYTTPSTQDGGIMLQDAKESALITIKTKDKTVNNILFFIITLLL